MNAIIFIKELRQKWNEWYELGLWFGLWHRLHRATCHVCRTRPCLLKAGGCGACPGWRWSPWWLPVAGRRRGGGGWPEREKNKVRYGRKRRPFKGGADMNGPIWLERDYELKGRGDEWWQFSSVSPLNLRKNLHFNLKETSPHKWMQ